jgi:hypothetical protein
MVEPIELMSEILVCLIFKLLWSPFVCNAHRSVTGWQATARVDEFLTHTMMPSYLSGIFFDCYAFDLLVRANSEAPTLLAPLQCIG